MPFPETTTADEVLEGRQLDGLVVVVTGATSGLGAETARCLAARGATVVATGRNDAAATKAAARLSARSGGTVEPVALELTDPRSVRRAATAILEHHPSVDVLINNAGVMAPPLERTSQGFELQFAANHLGHWLLTSELLPSLLDAGGRVVSLTSVGHWASDVVWDDPHFASTPYDRWVAYGQSKTANCLFVAALDRRYGSVGLDAFAVNPGVAMTRLARHLTPADFESMGEGPGGPPKVMSVAAAAATSVWAATAADLAGLGGRYLADCQVADDHAPWAFDPAGAERLWDMSEGMLSPV